jgi:WD40 repeat protein
MGFAREAKVWDVASGKELLTLTGHNDSVWEAVFSPDGTRPATAGKDGTARVWDAATGEQLHVLTGPTSTLFRLAFSPRFRLLARSVSGDRKALAPDFKVPATRC